MKFKSFKHQLLFVFVCAWIFAILLWVVGLFMPNDSLGQQNDYTQYVKAVQIHQKAVATYVGLDWQGK